MFLALHALNESGYAAQNHKRNSDQHKYIKNALKHLSIKCSEAKLNTCSPVSIVKVIRCHCSNVADEIGFSQ